MDEIVLKAMMRWPNVPAVYGWLKLDIKGRWLLQGDPITNTTIKNFISRNYESNDKGQWYFQNGPQKVFVELEYTPYIYKIWRNSENRLIAETHTGQAVNSPISCWLDEQGNLSIESELGIGAIEPTSLPTLINQLTHGDGSEISDRTLDAMLLGNFNVLCSVELKWNNLKLPLKFVEFKKLSEQFGFDPFPLPDNEK